jgi:hypothetical protein
MLKRRGALLNDFYRDKMIDDQNTLGHYLIP